MAWTKFLCAILLFLLADISFLTSAKAFFIGKSRIRKKDLHTNNNYTSTNETASGRYQNFETCNASVQNLDDNLNKRSVEVSHNSLEIIKTTTDYTDSYSEEFLNCESHTEVEPGCFHTFPNGSVFVPMYQRFFDQKNYIINDDILVVCSEFFDDKMKEKFSSNIDTVSIVGVSISTACILLHFIMFCFVEKMRNLNGYCLISLCCALLIFYVCFFIQHASSDQLNCFPIAMLKFYGLLSSFFWMNLIAFDVWNSIRMSVTKLRLSTNRSVQFRFALYSLYSWGSPCLIVIFALIIDHLTTDERFKLIFREDTCWFQNKNALLFYFALPFFILLFVNIIFFSHSLHMITQAKMITRDSGSSDDLKSRLFLALRLSTAMGLMWIFSVIAIVTQQEWLFFLYSACNALQGVFIFFSFTLNDKSIKACKKAFGRKKSSVMPTTTLRDFGHTTQYNTLQ